jgi:hypothetical protein
VTQHIAERHPRYFDGQTDFDLKIDLIWLCVALTQRWAKNAVSEDEQ